MERRWLMSAFAVLAVTAMPAMADDKAPEGAPAAPVEVQVAQSTTPVQVVKKDAKSVPEVQKDEAKAPPRFTYGGSLDGYFSSNFNDPNPPFNGLAVFDPKDEHGPHLGLFEVWGQLARAPWGGRIDLDWGPTARISNLTEKGVSGDELWDHIQQVYLSYNLNKKGSQYVDVGRWVTSAGSEVVEPKDNWLYSRSILYGFAIPISHTGIRYFNYLNDTDYYTLQVDGGWDTVSRPASSPGFTIGGGKKLNDKWTVMANYLGGEEPGPTGSETYRHLLDLIGVYSPGGKISYNFNFDLGHQTGATWYGLAAMAKYTISPKDYVAARAEFMQDQGGFRFGTGANTNAYEFTLGYARSWNKYFQSRVEYRHDFGSRDFFPDQGGGVTDSQGRFILSGILSY